MKKLISVALALALVLSMAVCAFAASTYIVAGSSGLCGTNWDPADTNNAMTQDGDVYTITYTNVPVGNYEFKVTDGSWSNSWGDNGGNYKFAVTQVGDITITFNPTTTEITVTGSGVGEATINVDYVIAVGAGAGNFLNNVGWEPNNEKNLMTEIAPDVYYIAYENVATGDYEYKFAANGTWDVNWGYGGETPSGQVCDAVCNGSNAKVFVEKDGSTVELTLDLSGINGKGEGAKITATVTAPTVEEEVTDIKYQTKDNSLRLVTWVDSLDYQEVVFNVTIDGETVAIPCTTVYSSINAGGVKLDSASEVFGEGAQYFVTYTIQSIPEGATEFEVSVTWTDLNGKSNTSAVRTITL